MSLIYIQILERLEYFSLKKIKIIGIKILKVSMKEEKLLNHYS